MELRHECPLLAADVELHGFSLTLKRITSIHLAARHAACNKPKAQAPRRASAVVSDRAPAARSRPWLTTLWTVCCSVPAAASTLRTSRKKPRQVLAVRRLLVQWSRTVQRPCNGSR